MWKFPATFSLLRQLSTSPPCRRSSWWLSQTDSGLDSGWNLIQCFKEKHRQNQIDSTSPVLCSLRFMRFARILNLPDMLFFMKVNMRFKVWRCQHYVKVIEKSDNIRLAQITCQILAVFFMSAGGRHQISWKIHLEAGVHFSFDVLPFWDEQGSCAHKCVSQIF